VKFCTLGRSTSCRSVLTERAHIHALGRIGARQAPGLPCHDVGEILQAEPLTALEVRLQALHPWEDRHVGYGVSVLNDKLPPLQPLLNDAQQALGFVGVPLHRVRVQALILGKLGEMPELRTAQNTHTSVEMINSSMQARVLPKKLR
jgi:hypothetical protein